MRKTLLAAVPIFSYLALIGQDIDIQERPKCTLAVEVGYLASGFEPAGSGNNIRLSWYAESSSISAGITVGRTVRCSLFAVRNSLSAVRRSQVPFD